MAHFKQRMTTRAQLLAARGRPSRRPLSVSASIPQYRPQLEREIDATWERTDDYLADTLLPKDSSLDAALESHVQHDLPQISVAPNQGKFLYLLALAQKAASILEIGTLAGYSTMWLARAAKARGGRVTTLEYEKKHADVARENLKRADLADRVTVVEGDARKSLQRLIEVEKLYDFVFLDADKTGYPEYLDLILQLTKPGSVIVADNVVRQGRVADPSNTDEAVLGVRQFFEKLSKEPRLESTAVQTVGSKGYDGFSYSVVIA